MLIILPRPVVHFAMICIALELCALASELTGFGPTLRNTFIVLGGFWPSLLGQGSAVYPGQGLAMFGSSIFLHGGPVHLLMNMLGLLWLSPIVVRRLGAGSFWPLTGLCALGSGLAFAALSQSNTPMIGASGVIFGFLGIVAIWAVRDRLARRQSLMPLIQNALVLILLNVAVMMLADGNIAWQAHLGGCLAGMAVGAMTWKGTGRRRLR